MPEAAAPPVGPPAENPWLRRLPPLVLAHTVGTANIVSVMAMAPVISDDLGLNAIQFGTLVSAYYAAQACGSLPAGGIADRYGVGRTLIGAHVVMAAAPVLLSFAHSYAASLVAMFLMGLGYCINNPSTARGVLEWFPREKRGTAMGIKQVGVPLGGIVGAGNGALAAYLDWHHVMLGVAVAVVLNGFYVATLLRLHVPPPEQRRSVFGNVRAVLRDWNFSRYAMVSGMANVGQTNFFSFLALFFTEAMRSSQQMAGFAIGLAQTSSAVARVGSGVMSDRWFAGRRKTLMAWICGAAAVLLALFGLIGAGGGWLLPALILTLLLGMTIAAFPPVGQAIAVEAVDPELAGSAMGVNMVGVHVGGMLGPVAFGAVADRFGGYGAAWLVTGGIVAVGTLILIFWFREGTERA